MVIKAVWTNVFDTEAKHIAFAINKEGINDSGFAGLVAQKYWPEIAYCGEHEIGTVLSKTVGTKTYHALVCHSLFSEWGDHQREIIKECFDKIPTDEPIATIAIGTGLVGTLSGASFRKIVCGMHGSTKNIILHSKYSLEAVLDCYNEEAENIKKLK